MEDKITARIRIKAGQFEIEYEGDEKFLERDLVGLVAQVADVFKGLPEIMTDLTEDTSTGTSAQAFDDTLSTNTIATRLKADTGPELIMAAVANLVLVKKKDTFSRREIAEEMKKAPCFYKKSFGSNLSQSIERLLKSDQLNLVAEGKYSLAAKAKEDLEDKLAG